MNLRAHNQEVCGLKWSLSGQQLASGGNDNLLHIWDVSMLHNGTASTYLHRFNDHKAAVKALAWCPFQNNLLASGGGTADRCIKFWNTQNGVCLNSVDTNSQVCALQWSKHEKELLSSHGFSQNQLCLWRYPSLVKMAELKGHTSRVLHLAQVILKFRNPTLFFYFPDWPRIWEPMKTWGQSVVCYSLISCW